jgi:hypothetical protein
LTYDDGISCDDKWHDNYHPDGWHDNSTCALQHDFFDIAHWLDINVTLFLPGNSLVRERIQHVVREFERHGHTIGSHTWSHINLATVRFQEAKADVQRADQLLASLSMFGKVHNFRAPYLRLPSSVSRSKQMRSFLLGDMEYTVWHGVNAKEGGQDWKEWELPAAEARKLTLKAASLVRRRFEQGDASVVLVLHQRPHSLRNVEMYAREICRFCPLCVFRALPRAGAKACHTARAAAVPIGRLATSHS